MKIARKDPDKTDISDQGLHYLLLLKQRLKTKLLAPNSRKVLYILEHLPSSNTKFLTFILSLGCKNENSFNTGDLLEIYNKYTIHGQKNIQMFP